MQHLKLMDHQDLKNGPSKMINVGGFHFEIPQFIIDEHPDSVLEAIFSGRHAVETVNGIPYLNRDYEVFKRILLILKSSPFESYQ